MGLAPTPEELTDFCAKCGTDIDPDRAAFSADGLICASCESVELGRNTRSLSSGTFGPLGWGAVSMVCNPFFIPSILAITGGYRELQTIKALEGAGERMTAGARTNAIVAIILGSFHPVLVVGLIGFVMVAAVFGAAFGPEPGYDDYAYDDYGYGDEYGGAYGGGHDDYGADPLPEYQRDQNPSAAPAPLAESGASILHDLPLRPQLIAHAQRAESLGGRRPYLYTHATWCGPCRAIAEYQNDPAMIDAFAGTYIIELDIDQVSSDELDRAGIHVAGIPAWYGIDGDGNHDGRVITGGAWDENIPANMAGPLASFFGG